MRRRVLSCAAFALTHLVVGQPSAEAQPLRERFTLRVEGGLGQMLSPYQRNLDPAEYPNSPRGYRFGTQGSVRVAFTVIDPVAVQLSLSNWFFLSDVRDTGRVMAPMVGLHVEPSVGTAGRFFADANVGYALTGDLWRTTLDLALGFEFAAGKAVGIGPVLRYGQVIQPDSGDTSPDAYPQDARYFTLGMSLALRCPHPDPPPPPPPPPPPRDYDHDGTLDGEDQCVLISAGDHPDSRRAGCPAPDSDQDGVFDDVDQCVATAAGAHADPERRGCPESDDDHDGVYAHLDRCPTEPAGRFADADRPGCPAPDRDHDGYIDANDRCPEQPEDFDGVDDDDGCPDTDASSVHIVVEIGENRTIDISHPIAFVTNNDRIVGLTSFRVLGGLRSILAAHPEITRVEVQGHTDNRGLPAANLNLSQRRADAVRNWLVQHGLEAGRVTARGFGATVPVRPNTTVQNRALNRRVEFHIVGLEAR